MFNSIPVNPEAIRYANRRQRRFQTPQMAGFLIILLFCSGSASAASCLEMNVGQLQNMNGFRPFAADNAWNTDISNALVDPNSFNILNFIGPNTAVKADFGSGTYRKQTIGIPYQIVAGTQPKVDVKVNAYPNESDPGPIPIPADALIEGYPSPGTGDRHVIVMDKDNCWLYELFNANKSKRGGWTADSVAIFDMLGNPARPFLWTSADAAGLSILPGLVRYEEILAGSINHAIRFTLPVTRAAATAPASHWASTVFDLNAPPMGMRMRLRADFDVSGYSRTAQIILTAMKKHGIILADNGSGIFISGAPDSRWNNDELRQLGSVKASDFQVVQMNTIYTGGYMLPSGLSPKINSFTANNISAVAPGTPVTLTWSQTGANYNIITPAVGPVRGELGFVTVYPTQTTTYTIHSANWYGRGTKTVTVEVR